jgi:hypothetical protein
MTREIAIACIVLLAAGTPSRAANTPAAAAAIVQPRQTKGGIIISPATLLYPPYTAASHNPVFAIQTQKYLDTDVRATGRSRFSLRMGGRFGIVRWPSAEDPERGVQVDFEAGYTGLFDLENHTDNLGYDGIYGFQVSWTATRDLALRLRTFHASSHLGDEYMEESERVRIGYTREGIAIGASWEPAPDWRTYIEGGYAIPPGDKPFIEHLHAQCGLEYFAPPTFCNNTLGWYAATDITTYEENDWSANVTVQAGFHMPVPEAQRRYRFGIEYYSGRSHIGELSTDDESYVGLHGMLDL